MSKLGQRMLALIIAVYPLAVYLGIQHFSLKSLLGFLLIIAALRFLLSREGGKVGARLIAAALAIVVSMSWLRNDAAALLWYPVLCNVALLAVFAWSLQQPQTIVERLARLRQPELSAGGVAYTRRVTKVWCAFFVANGVVATGTVLRGDMQLWALYNGLISYALMGLLLAGEWLVRRSILKSELGGS
ncbi:COG4648 family protein [Microbulbifer sp. 2201CG32-9]|uniref:COG4648 family protein n=1 Tax=Microbulbifer sp. 2201CG32-9 TaxID=3232309 RepID=UPI00345C054C